MNQSSKKKKVDVTMADETVTTIILQKLDRLQDGQDKQGEQIANIKEDIAGIHAEMAALGVKTENLVNRSAQSLCTQIEEQYVSKVMFPIMLDSELKKKKDETRANITFWQATTKNTWDIIKIVLTILAMQWLNSKGIFAALL